MRTPPFARRARRRLTAATAVILAILAAAAYVRSATNPDARAFAVARSGREVVGAQRPERLRYRATWNALPVANAELLVQPQPGGGRGGSVVLRGRADTNEVLDVLWRMRDSFEATVADSPVTPRRFVLRQNENGRHRDTTIVAGASRLTATVERPHRRTRRAELPLMSRLHDPASISYLIRTFPPELDKRPSYQVLAGTKIYDLTVTPTGTEVVDVANRAWPARRFHLALQLQPRDVEVKTPGTADPDAAERDDTERDRTRWRELKVQEADLWISSGPERLPLRMQARTFWGWVMVELVARGGQPSA